MKEDETKNEIPKSKTEDEEESKALANNKEMLSEVSKEDLDGISTTEELWDKLVDEGKGKDKLEILNEKFDDRNLESITEGDEDLNNEELDEIDLGG